MKKLTLLTTAMLIFAWSATALADVAPPIKVMLMEGSEIPVEGESYKGRLEITVGAPGELTDFRFEGDSWLTVSIEAPASKMLTPGNRLEVPFEVRPLTGSGELVFMFEVDGYVFRKNLDFTRTHALRMAGPAPVKNSKDNTAPIPNSLEVVTPADDEVVGRRGNNDPQDDENAVILRTIRVHGRFTYVRGDGTIMGADGVNVRVYDKDLFFDDLLASVATDAYGYYDVNINTNDAGENNPDLYVQFRAANSQADVGDATWGNIYTWETGTWDDFSGSTLNVGSLEPANESDHPSLHILTDLTRTWRWLLNREGYDPPFVAGRWPDGTSGAWYEPWSTQIHISSGRQWNEATHTHEYGHHFLQNYSTTVSPDYCNNICDPDFPSDCGHCIWCQETDHDAFNEGWPNWLADVLTRSYAGDYGIASANFRSQENLGNCGGSLDNPLLTEGFLGALCRDIEDSTNDDHWQFPGQADVLSLGTNEIFDVVDFDEPTTPMAFLNAFKARYPGHRENLWETAMNVGYQIDVAAPGVVTNLTSPSHSTSGDSPDPTIDFTWTTASDDASGIEGYGIYISSGGGSPSQDLDIGDVTSYTTDSLLPGTYYFTIRALDRAGRWSTGYGTYGPVTIREADPSDLTYYQHSGWDYPLVPSNVQTNTSGSAQVSSSLPGDTGSTYWSVRGVNQGEVSTGVGFQTRLYVDDAYRWWMGWGAIGAGGHFYGVNNGGFTVRGGRHTFEARYDATEQVAEDNELNNRWGHQFIWDPVNIDTDSPATKTRPPYYNAGWGGIVDGSIIWYNADGVGMNTTGWWSAVTVRAADHADDYDVRMHEDSTGSQNGYASNVAYSGRSAGMLDAVLINRNRNNSTMNAGILNLNNDDSNYTVAKRISTQLAFGDSVQVSMDQNEYLLLREFYVSTENAGFVSVTVDIDPNEGPVHVSWLDDNFELGTLSSSSVTATTSIYTGRARLDFEVADSGFNCLVIWRDQIDGGDALNMTIEIQTTPPDYLTYYAPGWHSPVVPRPADDGTPSLVALPDTLHGNIASTYYNLAVRNNSPTPNSGMQGRVFLDGVFNVSLGYGTFGGYVNSLFNWDNANTVRGGRHTLGLQLDFFNVIEEIYENNNDYGEQYVWSPLVLDMAVEEILPMPSERVGGWDIASGVLWYNCTGLRMPKISSYWWQAVAVMPGVGSDVDVRLHQPLAGTKSGFGANLGNSSWGFEASDFIIVDYNQATQKPYDAGVLNYGASQDFTTGFYGSTYRGVDPSGVLGDFPLPAGDIMELHEFYLNPGPFNAALMENSGNIDWGLSLYPANGEFHSKSGTVTDGLSYLNPAGVDEAISLTIDEAGYYCLAVWRAKSQDLNVSADYRLVFSSDLSPVDETNGLPSITALAGVYPNPFNPQTTIAFNLARDQFTELVIYDLQGSKVRTLVSETRSAGRHEIVWNGTDDRGQRVASGIFMARLKTGETVDLKKLVLVK